MAVRSSRKPTTAPLKRKTTAAAPLMPMEARQVDALPDDPGWQYEPKWDGFRCIGVRDNRRVNLTSKSGKPLTRYFPEIEALLASAKPRRFAVDGELCIPVGASLSFEALQLRLHPAASRVTRLSQETPALFILFDILSVDGKDIRSEPLSARRARLEKLFATLPQDGGFRLSPFTRSAAEAKRWLRKAGGGMLDGVVAKRVDEAYQSGERAMLKVKCLRTADCVVGGFRYATGSRQVGSLLLGLYNDAGKLDHVGFTSGIAAEARAALTKKLEALRGGEGFSGDAPGGPSRWSTERSTQWVPLRNKLVAEVQYDHVSGGRFRHGTRFLRWRPDKAPAQCTMEQLRQEARPSKLVARIFG
jgi:ATP-dependent DNA ligase